jgi:hypothetical protein
MATQWRQLTTDEIEIHPLNEKKAGLKTLIQLFCFFNFGSMGMAASSVSELYRALDDVSRLPSEDSAVLFAIMPSLALTIIFGYLIKSKTKTTLKIVIAVLWVSLFVSFIHSMTLGIIGSSLWVMILTISLVIYSYFSNVYNLQYLHRVRVIDSQ